MEKAVGAPIELDSVFDDAEWMEFVESAPDATPAHLIAWRDLIHGVFGYEPAYRVARRDGRICGAMPAFVVASALLGRHMISVPFLNSGGICAVDRDSRSALLAESRRMLDAHRARHFEMRCAYPPPAGVGAREHKVRIVLDLPDTTDQLWASLRSEVRNRVRRAEKCGLSVEFHSLDIDGFYRVFSDNMRDLGVPAHPRRFFEEVLQCFGAAFRPEDPATPPSKGATPSPLGATPSPLRGGLGRGPDDLDRDSRKPVPSVPYVPCVDLVVVKDRSDTVGGAIVFSFRETVEVPWVSCSRPHFDKCPNNLLYWEILRRACEQGFRLFDFGRSSPNSGAAVFKMRWGARAEQLYWHYILPEGAALPRETSSANPRFRLASALWKRMPRAVTNFLGPRLIAHLPG